MNNKLELGYMQKIILSFSVNKPTSKMLKRTIMQ